MNISEEKIKIVINNYFKTECSVDTTIREAFEKGFRLGIRKVKGQESPWIPVSERLPEEEAAVLVQYGDGSIAAVMSALPKHWCCITDRRWKIIAWMPLPEPYEGE